MTFSFSFLTDHFTFCFICLLIPMSINIRWMMYEAAFSSFSISPRHIVYVQLMRLRFWLQINRKFLPEVWLCDENAHIYCQHFLAFIQQWKHQVGILIALYWCSAVILILRISDVILRAKSHQEMIINIYSIHELRSIITIYYEMLRKRQTNLMRHRNFT